MRGSLPLVCSSATCLKVILALFCLYVPEGRALPAGGEASPAASASRMSAAPVPLDLDHVTALFAQVAIGGGYSTIFALLNTGSTDLSGRLVLTDSSGSAMAVALRSPPVESARDSAFAGAMDILIPRGGVKFISAEPVSADDGVRVGWARVESSGGILGGVATFQLEEAGELKTIAGVLASQPLAHWRKVLAGFNGQWAVVQDTQEAAADEQTVALHPRDRLRDRRTALAQALGDAGPHRHDALLLELEDGAQVHLRGVDQIAHEDPSGQRSSG